MANDKRTARERSPWAWVVGIVVVAVVGVILWGGNRLFLTPREQASTAQRTMPMPAQAKLYDPAHPVKQVTYRGATFALAPAGQAVGLPLKQAVVLGKTDEGYLIYGVNTQAPAIARNYPGAPVGGGGGVAPGHGAPKAVPQANSPVYLRTVNGLYLPLSQITPASGPGQGGIGGHAKPGGSGSGQVGG